jgi:murein DD-endopeptidase MepM/ murein hydrolase activator NlpD
MQSSTGRHRRFKHSRTTSLVIAAGVTGAGVALPLVGSTSAHAASVSTWDKVAQCESTNNWKINNGNGFFGGLQFTSSTWKAFGGTQYAPRADLATKDQQIAIAEKVLAGQGPGAWPVCSVKAGLTRGGEKPAVDTGSAKSAKTQKSDAPAAAPAQAKAKTQPKTEAPKAATAPEATVKNDETRKSAKPADATSYMVLTGDTLSRIATTQGVKGGWPALYEANRSTVGGDPDLILPGQTLTLSGTAKAETPKTETPKSAKSEAAPAPKAKTEAKSETKADQKPASRSNERAPLPASSSAKSGSSAGYTAPVPGKPHGSYGRSGSLWSKGHTGEDFSAASGTTVRAVTAGTVVSAGWAGAYGNEVVIRHADGKYSQYGHLSSISVKVGQKVGGGDKIALSGSTGNSTGPHLHFEIRTSPNYGSDVNPLSYLRAHGVSV